MFEFPNSEKIQSHRRDIQAKILGSFKSEKPQVSLIKGISVEQFDVDYPTETFERYSFDAINKAKDDFMKAEGSTDESVSASMQGLTPVVLQQGEKKKLVYVRKKA